MDQIYRNYVIKRDGMVALGDELMDDEEVDYFVETLCKSEFVMSDIIPLSYDGKLGIDSCWRYLDENGLEYTAFIS